MWQPDGWGFRARLGVLVVHAAIGPEAELNALAPEGVSIHAARIPFTGMAPGRAMDPILALAPVRAVADPPHVDEAAALLAGAPLHAIGFGFTGSSYLHGVAGDEALRLRLESRTHGIPVAITAGSAVLALRALGTGRLALVSPPWFPPELSDLGAAYFREWGLEVVSALRADVPSNQRAINNGHLYEWVRATTPRQAEAIFIGGNGLRAIGIIEALEADLGIPVLTANQVLGWHLLRLAGARVQVAGYGRVFACPLPA